MKVHCTSSVLTAFLQPQRVPADLSYELDTAARGGTSEQISPNSSDKGFISSAADEMAKTVIDPTVGVPLPARRRKIIRLPQGFLSCLGTVIVLLAGSSFARGESLINGGFEDPIVVELDDNYGTGSTGITGWKVTSGNVDVCSTGSSVLGDSHSGLQMLDINGSPGAGTIEQSFTTIVGQAYFLSLFYSNNPNPSFSVPSYNAAISILGASTLFSENVVHSGATQANMNWLPFERSFVADATTTTLRLQSLQGNFNGVYFDSVSITESSVAAIPEPSTFGLAAVGLLSAGLTMWWRRKRA